MSLKQQSKSYSRSFYREDVSPTLGEIDSPLTGEKTLAVKQKPIEYRRQSYDKNLQQIINAEQLINSAKFQSELSSVQYPPLSFLTESSPVGDNLEDNTKELDVNEANPAGETVDEGKDDPSKRLVLPFRHDNISWTRRWDPGNPNNEVPVVVLVRLIYNIL
jgi:hypothetical protein